MTKPAPAALICLSSALLLASTLVLPAEVQVRVGHHPPGEGASDFSFPNLPRPRRNDAAAKGEFTLVDGLRDANGAALSALNDGVLPTEEDDPNANFFFSAGTEGGRLLLDLGRAVDIQEINTFSWHPGGRGPQVYEVFASSAEGDGFARQPRRGTDPETCGWKRLARVNTRPATEPVGGQYAVSLTDSAGSLGTFRYLLFDVARTDRTDRFGQTFFSEVDVVERGAPPEADPLAAAGGGRDTYETEGGKFHFTLLTTEAPDLAEWARKELMPVVLAWYPKLVALLPSEGFSAPTNVTIAFKAGMGGTPAATSGSRVGCNREWFRSNLKGEAKGAVVHELVHVVQQYGRGPRGAIRPGWLTEGIPDYIRWYLYEPETRGGEISRRNVARARYDGSYRISANFLNWVTGKYDAELVTRLNAALRLGTYNDELWKTRTGHTVAELGAEWRAELEQKLGVPPAAAAPAQNVLTEAELAAGWKLLFNGRDFAGWHSFKRTDVRPGWQVRDGVLVCADPHNAGDLVTAGQYDWFELSLEYNISEAGNSGIMYHVSDEGGAAWASGPEFQLEDNAKASDPQRCGWLYALYQPPVDPKTDRPLDATKPAGEWTQVRLVISPERCEHWINGVKYFDYVLGSDDFKARVAKSKFGQMPLFARTPVGRIALQGDHGEVSFRNVRLRPLPGPK